MVPRIATFLILGAFLVSGCASKEQRIERIQSQYPQWDQSTVEKVASGRVEIGMTHEMVLTALGEPDGISLEGDEEEWGYAIWVSAKDAWSKYRKLVYFVYFKEGKVVRTEGDPGELDYIYWYK